MPKSLGCLCAVMPSKCLMKNCVFKKIFILLVCICLICATGCGAPKPNLVSGATLDSSSYSLGDYMGDYTVTDINGNSYVFSELLKTKKAIVLNFWFVNCGPCQMEFPYLQAAADSYSDDIVVIAINPTTDKENDIKNYATRNELSIPLVKGDEAWITAFGLQGFPTTVVIDRYGSIAFAHMGAVTESGVFEKIFKFFTADNYKQTTIKNISDIK